MAEKSIMERFSEEYLKRIPPGSTWPIGATAESLLLVARLRRAAVGVPTLLLSAMSDIDPVKLLLLMENALRADEIDQEMVEKLAGLLKVDLAGLPRPWGQYELSQGGSRPSPFPNPLTAQVKMKCPQKAPEKKIKLNEIGYTRDQI